MSTIRVRIAPSPSGFLHIGTAKIALFNWLFARKSGGTFILRLEDTDAERSSEEYAEAMCEGFRWLGIDWDEGPEFAGQPAKGAFGPYRQSLRKEQHRNEALRLLAEGKAYKCFCTKEELDAMRELAAAEKRPPRYNGMWRDASPEKIAAMGEAPFTVRFRVPEGETIINDLVQGPVRVDNKEFDDFIILKASGEPIFHLAVVADDGLMKVTHIMRGDDHLTNAARHVMLFNALGYALPEFAHLPMVLDEHGKKYSKRLHGANVLDWRDDGYLPETLVNYVALLGWTPADNREIFDRHELIEAFSIDRLGQSAAKFDIKKLQWLNGQHIRRLSAEDLLERLLPIIHKAGLDTTKKSRDWLLRMAAICQEKISTLNEIVAYTDFFFVDPAAYEEKAVKKQWQQDGATDRMNKLIGVMNSVTDWTRENLKHAYEALVAEQGIQIGQLVHPTRLALTGKSVGPGLFELAELLGKESSIARMKKAIAHIESMGAVQS
jgi:nondiscriminating glutamyl-tRNA synthetase